MDIKTTIEQGKAFLGIELGSTRIKAQLIDENYQPIASGVHEWENRLVNGVWTYHLSDVWEGIQNSYRNLTDDVQNRYGTTLTTVGAVGISAMMHGHLAFDADGKQLAEFRTWRNTTTEQAASELTKLFGFNIPQRWSIAHLYQAILNKEAHVKDISFMTTLAGYVHWMLTDEKVLGVGDASGMFPIENGGYNAKMAEQFTTVSNVKLSDIFPKVLNAGEYAGKLTAAGTKLLDPSGTLQAGIPLCPPEGDAGTGMVATNAISERTGNVSAGTSVFAMLVLEKELSKVHMEIDMVTTPTGKPVAMVHCNNCTSDLDAWVNLFGEAIGAVGAKVSKTDLYAALYNSALSADSGWDGLMSYNYFGGEPITNLEEGRPLFVRLPDAKFTLANFMRNLLFSAMGTLKLGMDILTIEEGVRLEQLLGHGGLFKTKGVAQKLMAAALNVPVAVMESAGEGGAWGIALLAAYMTKADKTLDAFLTQDVFSSAQAECINPESGIIKDFEIFMTHYKQGLEIEKAAVANLR